MNNFKSAVLAFFALASLAFGQMNTMTSTTLSAAIDNKQASFALASATNVLAPGMAQSQGGIGSNVGSNQTVLVVDKETMEVVSISSTTVTVRRGAQGSLKVAHLSGSKVWVGPAGYFTSYDRSGVCVSANELVLPLVNNKSGKVFQCTNGRWTGEDRALYVPPTQCTFAPTTLTTTNTFPQIGASNVFVLNGTTNAATGTLTLTCNIAIPSTVTALKGALLTDVTSFIGSQTTAPSAVGTATLGSITFPAAATTETASTVTPVALGSTVTTTSPTLISTVTTAGSFLTIKSAFAGTVDLSTDLRILQYTLPFTNGSAAAMTINTPGLLLHYRIPE